LFGKLRGVFTNIRETLEDGRYGTAPQSFWTDAATKAKDKLPGITKAGVAKYLPLLSRLPGARVLVTAAVAAVTLQSVVWGALALAGTVLSFGTLEYLRCRRARENIISEENFAGQTVRGRRGDLHRLHKAQQKIVTLATAFNAAAAPSAGEEISAVIEQTRAARSRVVVIDNGKVTPQTGLYEFFDPRAKREPPKPQPGNEGDGIADYIVSLEQALPQQVREKVRRRRAAVPAT
jgi:hypothetical protein